MKFNSDIQECDGYWLLYTPGCTRQYNMPLSKRHVERERWRVITVYGCKAGEAWLGQPEMFKLWSKLIAAIHCPLDG